MGRTPRSIFLGILVVALIPLTIGLIVAWLVLREPKAEAIGLWSSEIAKDIEGLRASQEAERRAFATLLLERIASELLRLPTPEDQRRRAVSFLKQWPLLHAIERRKEGSLGPLFRVEAPSQTRIKKTGPKAPLEAKAEEFKKDVVEGKLFSGERLRIEIQRGFGVGIWKRGAEEAKVLFERWERRRQAAGWSFFWAALSMLLSTLGLGLLVATVSLRPFWARLQGLRQQIWQVTPTQGPSSSFHPLLKDPIEGLKRDIILLLRQLQEQQQNEVFREQVARWQDIARRLAHEIKNPLTPILLAVQELHKRYDGGSMRYRKLLDATQEIVQEEVETLRRLVEEFSSFAKLPQIEPHRADLQVLVREFLDSYKWFRDQVDLHFLPSEEGSMWSMIDRMMFKRVLHNLALNAIEAGTPVLYIRVGRLPGHRLICQFEDRGPGIPAHLQSKIFTPYFTTKKFGSGLGLAIAKKIIIDHGGTITVGANTQGGATFSILLPEAPVSQEGADQPATDEK